MNRKFAASWGAMALMVLAACAEETPANNAAPQEMVELYALDCGRITLSDADVFADDGAYAGQAKELVDPCYLIRHPMGDMIWDAGLPAAIADAPEGVDNGPFHLELETTLTDQLARLGLTPEDIDIIAFSHSHFDHVGQASMFTNARWIVDADERAWMFRDEARADSQTFGLIAPLETWPSTTLIEGAEDFDVFGDGRVLIVQAPGHTPGHTVLVVKLPNSGPFILSGDMWHIAESQAARRTPRFNVDREQTIASMDKIEALARDIDAVLIRQHVPADQKLMAPFPNAHD